MGDDEVPAGDRQRCPCVALLAATLIAAPRLRLLAARLRHGVAGGAWSLRVSYGRYVVAMLENIPHADANSAPSVPKEATRRHKTYAENGKSRMVDHLLLSTAKASVTDLDHHMVVWIDWTRFRRTSRSQIRGRAIGTVALSEVTNIQQGGNTTLITRRFTWACEVQLNISQAQQLLDWASKPAWL